MNTIEYTPEIISLLEKSARIGWWRADFGTQTFSCSNYLNSLLRIDSGEVPLDVFFGKLPDFFQERLRAEASLTDREIGFFEYRFQIETTIGKIWMYMRVCKTTQKEDGSFIAEGFARCLDEDEQAKMPGRLTEEVAPMLHWQAVSSKLALRIIYGEDSSSVFSDILDVVRNRYKCDRAFMVLFDSKNKKFSCIHESRTEGLIPSSDLVNDIDYSRASWLISTITSGQPIFLDTLDNMPPEAVKERAFLTGNGTSSVIFLPMVSENGAWGYFGISSNTPRLWSSFEREWLVVMSYSISACFELDRTRNELQRSEQMHRMVYSNLPIGIELYDRDARLITANEAACSIFQTKTEDNIGSCMFDWPSFASHPEMIENVRQGQDVSFDNSYDFPTDDGSGTSTRHLSFQCTTIRGRDGQIENYLLVVIDNTEKIQTYLDLKRFQDSLDSISEFAQVGISEMDVLKGEFTATEQCYKNINLWPGATLQDIKEVAHPEDMHDLIEFMHEVKKGNATRFSKEIRVRDGNNWKWLRFMNQVTKYDPSNGHINIFGLNIDISAMKEIEHNLWQAKLKAEESDRVKTAFLSSMSHEIRTPLNAIIGFSNLLGDIQEEAMRKEIVGAIENNNRLLLRLVSDILDFSSIEAGIMNIIPTEINVNQLLEHVVDIQMPYVPANVQMIVAPHEGNVLIHSDKDRIQQMLTQFVSNATKFTRQGFIRIGYTVCTPNIEFWVQDSGIGMSTEQAKLAFDRFVKFNDFSQGTGLGLSICKSIIDVMGGQIGVDSEPGQGSRFWFRVPTTIHSINGNPEAPQQPENDTVKPLILVAEDADFNFLLISSILKNEYRLVHAIDGSEAVDMYRQHHPDLVLMDISMPVMDGLRATQLIRQMSPTVPVIALTAYAMDSDRKAAFDAGCTGFLSKPVISSEIRNALRKCLAEKRA